MKKRGNSMQKERKNDKNKSHTDIFSRKRRMKYFKEYIEGSTVLHIGCINHDWRESLKEEWMHDYIVQNSKEVLGIDILEDDIKELRKMGYDIIYANAEDFELNKKFDIIFAGELIEHLNNLKGFLESCKRHMSNDSLLLISTPNCFGIRHNISNLLGTTFVNTEHRYWFDYWTLRQLLEYNGFDVVCIDYGLLDRLDKFSKYLAPTNVLNTTLQCIEYIFPKLAPRLFVVARKKSK